MLMNVGPTHDGRIIPIFEERLMQMGKIVCVCMCVYMCNLPVTFTLTGSWLETNGEAIYNTTHWTYQNDTANSDMW